MHAKTLADVITRSGLVAWIATVLMIVPVENEALAGEPSLLQKGDTTHKHGRDSTRAGPQDTIQVSMAGPLGISMERMGSGTTWIPDAVILPSRHYMRGKWMLMLHGFAFAQYDRQSG